MKKMSDNLGGFFWLTL